MSSEYTLEKKKQLARKISKIKDTEIYREIFRIIQKDNSDYTENKNGVLVNFNGLSDSTYKLIENIINNNINNNSDSFSTDYVSYSNDDDDAIDKYKLSNKEKNIIKRKSYEQSDINNIDYF